MTINLPTPYQTFIYKSRYSRWLPEENRRENWDETVKRYFDFFSSHLQKQHNYTIPAELRKELEEAVLNLEIMPSMRALMAAGPALERCNVAGYNCSYIPVDSIRAFDEILYVLMCGTGVGFSVERRNTEQLPIVNEHFEQSGTTIVVEDSKAGWARAYKELIGLLYTGQVPQWDVSKLRPAGARLKTFGGRSSGPEPLVALFEFTVNIFKHAAGRRLTPLECHDLVCKVADVVVVGGVRRSALISLSDLTDTQIRDAKSGAWWEKNGQRALANNSANYNGKPDVLQFMTEWQSLVASGSGERGIYNREASYNNVKKHGRRDADHAWGTNPSLRKGTKVWTTEGVFPIEELQDKQFNVRNLHGQISPAKCWLSGKDKPLYAITLKNNAKIYATAEHKWPVLQRKTSTIDSITKHTTDNLTPGMFLPVQGVSALSEGTLGTYQEGFVVGWCLGDGWMTERDSGLQIGFSVYGRKRELGIHTIIEDYLTHECGWEGDFSNKDEINVNNPKLREMFTRMQVQPKELGLPKTVWTTASEEFRMGLLDGLYSSDGHVEKDKARVRICSSKPKLMEDLSELLSFYGINGTIRKSSSTAEFPNGKDYAKEYPRYDYTFGGKDQVSRFNSFVELAHLDKQERLDEYTEENFRDRIQIKSVIKTDLKEDVWDVSVDSLDHCFQIAYCTTGNCSEIILRPYQFCNLSEVVVRSNDDEISLTRKVKLATILGTFQSTLTNFKYLRKCWVNNTAEERLLGVSLTGILDNRMMKDATDILDNMRVISVATNASIARDIGIPVSTAITCVKPSGTVSQLTDASSGIHTRHSPYYIRTVRGDAKDPLSTFLREVGVPCEPCVMKPNDTVVFSFPMKAPEGALVREDLNALEHLEVWLNYQRHWCEHKPSITISVKEEEWLEVGAWVYKHFDEISGISFLPYSEHTYQQAPYQECSKEDYEALLAKMPTEIDWSKLADYEKEDTTTGTQELACSSGVCEIL